MKTKRALSALALAAAVVALALGATGPASAADAGGPEPAKVATSGPAKDSRATATAAPTGRSTAAVGAVSYRHYWGAKNGQWILTLNGLPVTAGQAVAVTVSESDGAGNEFIGDARMTIHNVAVGDGWVAVRVNIEYGSPLNIWLHYLG